MRISVGAVSFSFCRFAFATGGTVFCSELEAFVPEVLANKATAAAITVGKRRGLSRLPDSLTNRF